MELEREKKSVNGLGIASLVFGIVGILTICGCGIGFFFGLIGVILGILGLTVLKNSGKGFPVAGLIVSGVALVFGSFWMAMYIPRHNSSNPNDYLVDTSSTEVATTAPDKIETPPVSDSKISDSSSDKNDTESTSSSEDLETSWNELKEAWNDLKKDLSSPTTSDDSSSSDSEPEEISTDVSEEESDPLANIKRVGIGEEFGNKTVKGQVTDVDLDYDDYNSLWTTVPEDKKCIYIKIKVTNISNESNYVSVGDFDCYVDNIAVMPELVNGMGDDPYNENLDPGRSAILGALYVVPKNASSIELEYNPLGEFAERVIIEIK